MPCPHCNSRVVVYEKVEAEDGDYKDLRCLICGWRLNRKPPEPKHDGEGRRKRENKTITFNGKTMTLSQWARNTGIPQGTLRTRYFQLGWSAYRTLKMPVKKQSNNV